MYYCGGQVHQNMRKLIVCNIVSLDSYEGFRSYWPAIAGDMSQPAVEREISHLNGAIQKVVVSNSLKPNEVTGGVRPTSCGARTRTRRSQHSKSGRVGRS
jgi:hypothetical protein